MEEITWLRKGDCRGPIMSLGSEEVIAEGKGDHLVASGWSLRENVEHWEASGFVSEGKGALIRILVPMGKSCFPAMCVVNIHALRVCNINSRLNTII
ncbi:hypothetical protein DPMN_067875 [Dreissena polymorpha]|uniref:Uncharacterized protein n=1 Tax=Dreissena polymorpha TaxID=45954 RepID=A0A9D4BT48_DREPO|nr:hypothetical protein DPMN_067875 [Dreissena polymorpha]